MGGSANPFTPGSGLDPPYLAGREGEVRAFGDMLRGVGDGRVGNIMLYGLRGVGKTVLLGRFAKACRDGGFLPLAGHQYSAKESNPDMFADSIECVLRGAVEPHPKAAPDKGGNRPAKGRARPPAAGDPGAACREPPSLRGRRGPLVDRLADYLVKNWKAVDGQGYRGAIFLLDEFHTITT